MTFKWPRLYIYQYEKNQVFTLAYKQHDPDECLRQCAALVKLLLAKPKTLTPSLANLPVNTPCIHTSHWQWNPSDFGNWLHWRLLPYFWPLHWDEHVVIMYYTEALIITLHYIIDIIVTKVIKNTLQSSQKTKLSISVGDKKKKWRWFYSLGIFISIILLLLLLLLICCKFRNGPSLWNSFLCDCSVLLSIHWQSCVLWYASPCKQTFHDFTGGFQEHSMFYMLANPFKWLSCNRMSPQLIPFTWKKLTGVIMPLQCSVKLNYVTTAFILYQLSSEGWQQWLSSLPCSSFTLRTRLKLNPLIYTVILLLFFLRLFLPVWSQLFYSVSWYDRNILMVSITVLSSDMTEVI